MAFQVPALPYSFDALEPHIDTKTMEIHHDKHHAAYVAKLNEALAGTEFESKPIEWIITNITAIPEGKRMAVRNNGGGHYNHSLFWQWMAPNAGGEPAGEVGGAIQNTFGNFDAFKKQFETAGATRFGSGWAWLVLNNGKLEILSTPNQDNPLTEGKKPILGVDVWEHAYYLKYQNRRPDYLSAFWNVVNWKQVEATYQSAK
jgi:Fe-Mn family superoxide dismutase